ARGRVEVGVADAARDEADEHLPCLWLGKIELLDLERLAEPLEHGGANLHVRFNGALGDEEALGDPLVREAFGDEAQDFSLAIGELSERILAPTPADE